MAIAITALSGLAKGGHPPLIAIVAVFAIQIVGLLWLGMCFLIARRLMEVPRR